jgi:hypothetical protein
MRRALLSRLRAVAFVEVDGPEHTCNSPDLVARKRLIGRKQASVPHCPSTTLAAGADLARPTLRLKTRDCSYGIPAILLMEQ